MFRLVLKFAVTFYILVILVSHIGVVVGAKQNQKPRREKIESLSTVNCAGTCQRAGVNNECHTCCQTGCGTYYQITVEIFGKCVKPWFRDLKCTCTVYEILPAVLNQQRSTKNRGVIRLGPLQSNGRRSIKTTSQQTNKMARRKHVN